MLPNGGYFKRFHCPDAKKGECNRPFCHYGHFSSDSTADNSSAAVSIGSTQNGIQQLDSASNCSISVDDDVPSYSTVPTEHFQGYQGYFATSSSPPPPPPPAVAKRPLLPTPKVQSGGPLRNPRSVQLRQRTIQQRKQNPAAKPAASSPSQQNKGNLNMLAKDLAVINNEIERLQRKLNSSSEQSDGDEGTGKVGEDEAAGGQDYDPEAMTMELGTSSVDSSSNDLYQPKAASNGGTAPAVGSKSAYKPTPIGELQKLTRPKNKLLKEGWTRNQDGKDLATAGTSKMEKKRPSAQKTTTKSAALLEKKNEKKQTDSTNRISQLFGDDSGSDGEVKAGRTALRKIPKTTSTSNSREDHDDMASIIEDLIAPTTAAQHAKREKVETPKDNSSKSVGDDFASKKRRVAHSSDAKVEAVKKLRESGGERPKGHLMTAREQLESRFAQLKKTNEELQMKAQEISEGMKNQQLIRSTPLEVGTHPKHEKRMARLPKGGGSEPRTQSTEGRPTIPIEVGSKVPSKVRQQYLNLIIDEYLKTLSREEAYREAVEEERGLFLRSMSKAGYINSVACAIKRIRGKECAAAAKAVSDQSWTKPVSSGISHSAVIGGKQATKHSYTVGRSGVLETSSRLSGDGFYNVLLPFVISIDQQVANGYPRPDPEKPGWAVYQKVEIKKMFVADDDAKRICIRCGTLYQITPEGEYFSRDECIFHWGRAWKKRIAGAIESRYTCCQGDLNSAGCSVSQYHVTDCMPQQALSGYVYTGDWSTGSDGTNLKVFAVDCEMVYTTWGSELARVTMVNDQSQVIYERCVRPEHMILDYNTRFSGLTEKLLSDFTAVTLQDVQNDLSKLISTDCILIGHSLESDLRALKIIHDKVVDTSIVFPHRLGAPYKRALKTLAVEFLNKIIQDDVDGHDSKEDATTCMELMKWRVKQDARRSKS